MSKFAKFVRSIIKNSTELEHPDKKTMEKVIINGKRHGLSPKESWQAYLTASEYRSLIEQEKLDGGTGNIARNVRPELLMELSSNRRRK